MVVGTLWAISGQSYKPLWFLLLFVVVEIAANNSGR
jgi:hypothetical protein